MVKDLMGQKQDLGRESFAPVKKGMRLQAREMCLATM